MAALLALLPTGLLLLCMAVLGWSAARSGLISAAAAVVIAVLAFGYVPDKVSLAGPLLEAAFITATILWIVFPALALYEVQARSGASERLGIWLASVSDKPQVTVIILAWFFALLLEGAAGFGTPVALVAPMLVGFGFSPHRALVLALIGHAAGVSFGAVGTPILPLLSLRPIDAGQLALMIMLLHAALGWSLVLVVSLLARRNRGDYDPTVVTIAALGFFLPALGLAWLTGPELPTLGGAIIGGVMFVTFARWQRPANSALAGPGTKELMSAVLPYMLILVAITASRIVPTLTTSLQSIVLDWKLTDRFTGSVMPLYHPGTMLMLALAATATASRERRRVMLPSLIQAARRLPMVGVALVSVLLLSRILVHSGMIDVLAETAASIFGSAWSLVIPTVAALGSFITGSATASNILFGGFQLTAAEATGLSPLHALAGQGFGAAIGNIIAPHNIVAGAATVGLIGREGRVLKITFPLCLAYALAGGVLLLAWERA